MRQFLFIGVLVFLLSMSPTVYAIDIASYSVEKEELTPEKGESAKWQNYLRFSGSPTKIKLARTLKRDGQVVMGYTDVGLDAKTIKVNRLSKDIILITWGTFSQTEPGYDYSDFVILKYSDENIKELFRQNLNFYWYQGGCTHYKKNLNISCSDNEIKLELLNHQEECANEPIPQGVKSGLSEPVIYLKKIDETSVWKYRVANDALQFVNGQMSVDLGTARFNLPDIASYYGTSVEILKALNRKLAKDPIGTGKMIINENLKKLKADQYDGLYGIHGR
jgi:hypothetical protein